MEINAIKKEIWMEYGENYRILFENLLNSGEPNEQLAETGRRALSYFIRSNAFEELNTFASILVTNTGTPYQLQTIISELYTIIGRIPKGEIRWTIYTYLADALYSTGQLEQALTFYQQAHTEAEIMKDWSSVGWICHNMANTLANLSQLSAAREIYIYSLQSKKKAKNPKLDILATELEIFRLDIMQAKKQEIKKILFTVEKKLKQIRKWWGYDRKGFQIKDVPNTELLKRTFVTALNILEQANLDLNNWEISLNLLSEREEIENAFGETEYSLAVTHLNRYIPLLRLGRLDEAQQVLEKCLYEFDKVGDLASKAIVLSGLASIWHERGDLRQAIYLTRQALAMHEQLKASENSALCHHNLSIYLHQAEQLEEAAKHVVAALVYYGVTESWQEYEHIAKDLAIDIYKSVKKNSKYSLPYLKNLLDCSEFNTLAFFLQERKVEINEVQIEINKLLDNLHEQIQESVLN